MPYCIIRTGIPRAVRWFLRAVRPRGEVGLVAVWIFASLAEDRCRFVIDHILFAYCAISGFEGFASFDYG